jgi:hypothetical protein
LYCSLNSKCTLISELFFAPEIDRVDAINRTKLQTDVKFVDSSVIYSEIVPDVTFPWKNAVFSEFESGLCMDVALHQEGAITGAARICNGDDVFDEVVLALLL